jgi:NAD(P)H-dependent FMN reductase
MIKIAIILGSTRPNRNGEAVAKWVCEVAKTRSDAESELVDIKDFNLPLLDEPVPPSMGQYSKPHTKAWAAKIGSFDAYVFVTPEYNHGTSGALKNAIDFLFAEWNNKAAGFVSYGGAGGARAVEHLRLILAEVQMATVRNQVLLSLFTDFENFSVFKPGPTKEQSVNDMLDQVIAWGDALRTLRKTSAYESGSSRNTGAEVVASVEVSRYSLRYFVRMLRAAIRNWSRNHAWAGSVVRRECHAMK